jgi:UDP-N-acetylmuramoyl-L-alanyl-D-glutamate--2,6-diaminopimelate ligase
VVWATVSDGRLALALLAAHFSGHPSRRMRVVGITGTNGKTTTSYLVQAAIEAAGIRCGLMGTVQYRIGDDVRDAARTTPEAPDVQQMLGEMLDAGCGACAMEVSSHALALRRVDGTRFAAAVFTNLTRDHLDYHEGMDGTANGGCSAARAGRRRRNVDDRRGRAGRQLPRCLTYAVDRPADVGPESLLLVRAPGFAHAPAGRAVHPAGRPVQRTTSCSRATGARLPGRPSRRGSRVGRCPADSDRSAPGDDVTVIVDYAHTDDLKNLSSGAPIAAARLTTVFGCGGDRDRTKRPLMGAVAARLSDTVGLTSDNPRTEDPERIIDEIELGFAPPQDRGRPAGGAAPSTGAGLRWWRVTDRRAAIDRAISEAGPGDVVVIAGKG